jgi:hypothetical protein
VHIQEVITYGGAWETLNKKYTRELESIKLAMSGKVLERRSIRTKLEKDGWRNSPSIDVIKPIQDFLLRDTMLYRQSVAVLFPLGPRHVNAWLYTTAPAIVNYCKVEVPVVIIPLRAAEKVSEGLGALSPISHPSPFLVLGISIRPCNVNVIELKGGENINFRQIIVNRAIEFPPQYHQACLGVLSYFGSVLREKYPSQEATVRIEQDGLVVRLIVESENGNREVIEKALEEYELVLRGEVQPEEFFVSSSKVLELKNELRIAQLRIDYQRDMMQLQGQQVSSLQQLIGHALSSRNHPKIMFSPSIIVSNTLNSEFRVRDAISDANSDLEELIAADVDDSIKMRLLDLRSALDMARLNGKPDAVANSSGIKKLRALVEDTFKNGSKISESLKTIEGGIETAQSLGRKYNAIAEWCGIPQIPSALLGSE